MYAEFAERCSQDLEELSRNAAHEYSVCGDGDCCAATSTVAKIAIVLQMSAAADTGDTSFEIANANSRTDYQAWTGRVGRNPNKELVARWMIDAGIHLRASIGPGNRLLTGVVRTASEEWTWNNTPSVVIADI